eukprot:2891949-Rhodomonas_salina.1
MSSQTCVAAYDSSVPHIATGHRIALTHHTLAQYRTPLPSYASSVADIWYADRHTLGQYRTLPYASSVPYHTLAQYRASEAYHRTVRVAQYRTTTSYVSSRPPYASSVLDMA